MPIIQTALLIGRDELGYVVIPGDPISSNTPETGVRG